MALLVKPRKEGALIVALKVTRKGMPKGSEGSDLTFGLSTVLDDGQQYALTVESLGERPQIAVFGSIQTEHDIVFGLPDHGDNGVNGHLLKTGQKEETVLFIYKGV